LFVHSIVGSFDFFLLPLLSRFVRVVFGFIPFPSDLLCFVSVQVVLELPLGSSTGLASVVVVVVLLLWFL
jgi:hypothetical protein